MPTCSGRLKNHVASTPYPGMPLLRRPAESRPGGSPCPMPVLPRHGGAARGGSAPHPDPARTACRGYISGWLERHRRTEARIYQYLCLWGIDAGLGWETAATDAELARRFPAVEPGEYTRVCHLIEKHIYGEILLSPYEERTLNHFLEKLMEPVPGCSWKMRLKLRYACLRRVNTKKKKRKHSAFQQK